MPAEAGTPGWCSRTISSQSDSTSLSDLMHHRESESMEERKPSSDRYSAKRMGQTPFHGNRAEQRGIQLQPKKASGLLALFRSAFQDPGLITASVTTVDVSLFCPPSMRIVDLIVRPGNVGLVQVFSVTVWLASLRMASVTFA